jgi:hypothetical protein
MIRIGLLASLMISACASPQPRAVASSNVSAAVLPDTALIRRLCVAEADSSTVNADSLLTLARTGCVLRDQRTRIRIF